MPAGDDSPDELLDVIDDAYEALGRGELDAARKLHSEAVKLSAGARDVGLLEAELLEAEGQGEEALAAVESLQERYGDDLLVAFTYARLLLDIFDDVPDARPVLEEIKAGLDRGDPLDLGYDDEEDAAEARAGFTVDLLLTLADCRAADRDPRGALVAAEQATTLRSDDPIARVCLAGAKFDLGDLDGAEKTVALAVDLDPRCADAFWLRGRILTVRGDHATADAAFERACAIDPERFNAPIRMDEDTFAETMKKALSDLPDRVQDYLENVAIAVEDLPPLDRLRESDPPLSPGLLGLYEGTPPSLAPGDDPWAHHPRHITLFRKNIEVAARDEAELQDLIATTLWHEIGHYLGLDEEDLDERGLG